MKAILLTLIQILIILIIAAIFNMNGLTIDSTYIAIAIACNALYQANYNQFKGKHKKDRKIKFKHIGKTAVRTYKVIRGDNDN